MKKIIKIILVNLVFLLLLMELIGFIGTKLQLFAKNITPHLYGGIKMSEQTRFKRTEKDVWGAWRLPNIKSKQIVGNCINITYETNEVGARDDPFVNLKSNSIFLLGDSFAEGYGVEKNDSTSDLLEEKFGRDILNFSSSTFGPLQYLLIYKNFKDKYDHEGIIIYFLPSNDFTDNDYAHWLTMDRSRYKPYFNINNNVLEPYFFPEAKKIYLNHSEKNKNKYLFLILDNFWSSNLLRTIRAKIVYRKKISNHGYFYSTEKQQKNVLLAFKEITKIAKDKKILFVLIPGLREIKEFREKKYIYKKEFWYKEMIEMSKSKNINMLDLMEYLPEDHKKIYATCDAHWSKFGEKWAAEIIYKTSIDKKIFN